MGTWRPIILFSIFFAACFHCNYGCEIEGVNWPFPLTRSILDTFRGDIIDISTSGIDAITNVSPGEGLNFGPYVDVTFADSRLRISTNSAYNNYEENETLQTISTTVQVRCTGGSSRPFAFIINVQDTNNNAPRFLPSNEFVFTISPPVPPGFEVTGCFNDLTVRDIDLTTQRIDFTLDNPYFEIEYDAVSSTTAKEFKAILRTKTLIRTITEPIELTITATDVDLTDDPPQSTTATVTIKGNLDFELPEEPVFSQSFYLAKYTNSNQLVLTDLIYLRNGFDELVQFTLEGDYKDHFELVMNENSISIRVATPLTDEALIERQILVVVRASREYTSGASATVIIQLPEEVLLEFESAHYEGTIENGNLQVPELILSQGYDGASVSATVINEHSSSFAAVVQGNSITLTMTPLDESVINSNSFIYLQVVASTDRSTATTIVTLEIIKDDSVTPVFNRPIYTGSYSPDAGLAIEPITIVQGYDETVSISLHGDLANSFELTHNGPIITLQALTIPPEIYAQGPIMLSIRATKPRTVGAFAAVVITLPAARELKFQESTYKGSIQDNTLALESILLTVGYDENVEFVLSGEYSQYFSVTSDRNLVTLTLATAIPVNILLDNNVVVLTLAASALNAVTTTTNIVLYIIKEDVDTPVFSRNIYYGTYDGISNIALENMNLIQGYDDSVSFRLDGDHSQYFEITREGTGVALSLRSPIPVDVIFNEKVLLVNVLAEKPLTVGAHAAVLIRFPPDLINAAVMSFTHNTYIGKYENNALTVDNIILVSGYAEDTVFLLSGEHSTHFDISRSMNIIRLSLRDSLPSNVIENKFIVLEIQARRERAVSAWTSVVIDITQQEIVPPVFTEAYYRGVYNADTGLQFDEVISLLFGFDETVIFRLEGEFARLFTLELSSTNSFSIRAVGTIPNAILESNNNLLFTVVAVKPGAVTASSAITIDIEKEAIDAVVLRFAQNNYVGNIQNGELQVPTITLVGSGTEDVSFRITGDYAQYFTISRNSDALNLQLTTVLPPNVIEENAFIILEVVASQTNAINGYTTAVIEILKEHIVTPLFDRAYYAGEYSDQDGLRLENTIRLIQGFTESVIFTLDGDDSRWFDIVRNKENDLTLTVSSNAPPLPVGDRSHLLLSIVANKPSSAAVSAAIIISLTDFTPARTLQFSRDYYTGTIEGNNLMLGTMSLEGYSDAVAYTFSGDYADYFHLTNQNGVFTLQLLRELSAEVIAANKVVILTLQAQIENTRTHTTVILEIIAEDDDTSVVQPVFAAPYYTGSYTTAGGLAATTPITLSEGYDDSVQFALEGEHAQWFSFVQTQNSVSLTLSSAIPGSVIINNQQLVFVITARRPNSNVARATIVISLTDEYTEISNIGFDRVSYLGSIQDNAITLGPITVIEGYTDAVTFGLYGELVSYFSLSRQGPVVNVAIGSPIPGHLIPTNRIIMLEIRASAPQTGIAQATIVLEAVAEQDDTSVVQPVFAAPYYTGSYTTAGGLAATTPITLSEGYDDSVQFALEGEHAQWFSFVQTQNSVSLTLSSAIPGSVITNNQQLVFVITARRPNSNVARATIVISLTDEYTEISNIGFDRVSYLGSIQDNAITLGPITVTEGYTDAVTFGLYGELVSYFSLSRQGPVVNVAIGSPIPGHLIPTNRIIMLEIRASAPQTGIAQATIVLEAVAEQDDTSVVQPVFAAPYYTGSYTTAGGLAATTPITLSEGYDDSVQFALEGEHAQWFSFVQTQNSVSLTLSSAIPGSVITNNQQLVFVITARRPNSNVARATIVISLTDEYTEISNIGFDRVSYLGSIQDNAITLGPITVTEGYTDAVTFGLYGELVSYFSLSRQGPVVNVAIGSPIPGHLIPTNRIIMLEIRASAPQTGIAQATIVLEAVAEQDDTSVVQPVFAAPYYTGSYTTAGGLAATTPITLSEGYDDSVQFALDGEHAQWFSFVQTQNSVSLTLSSAIPGSVIINNQQLVFVITARRPNSNVARATIVISLTDEYTEISNIGFDRVSYLGSIQDNAITLGPITVTEGYTDAVTFGLYGELVSYFSLSRQGPVVNVAIGSPIPGHLIPTNRIIMLEIRASAPQTGIAQATIVLEAVAEQDDTSVVQPVFAAPYYTGSYTTAGGLAATTPITLSEGYDDSVQFALDGEHAQWFSFVQTQNSVSLTLSSAIPGSVIINNQQLVFVITARRPNSNVARATIVISLTDEYTEISNIGFDRVSYLGSIQDNAITLGPITVTEGYTDAVTFGLYGELVSYFSLSIQGPVVNVAIGSPIPGHLIPTNRIIMLEIRASAPQTGIAQATIVLEAVAEQDDTSVVQPVFAAPYYTGSYTTAGGLAATTPITLSEGYDDSVQFALDGEHAQWFSFVQTQNSVSLTLSSAIPGSLIINNQQLVFVITARRPNSNVARATIVISLTDEYTEISNIGFDRVSYLGSIQDNAITLGPITVTEGYTDAVTFGLYGELVSYFSLSRQGPVVNVAIGSPIPGHLIPTNRIIMLEIRASAPQTGIAQATIVLEAVAEQDDTSVVQPVFAAPYYTGSYTTAGGLAATTPITLSEGYDDSVQFALDGEHAQWFSFVQTQNSVSLTLSSAIPGSVIINNQQLVFVITARRPNSNVARATIVISLTDEYTEISNIGFDRVSYLGSIQDNAITLGPITVTEGYTDAVTFGLYGELVSYFSLSIQGPVVNVAIGSPIPGHLIPTNRIIMLEIRASAPQTGIAQATIVLEAVAEQDDTSVVQPVFAAPYYTGSYTTAGGLAATTPITLSEGYDDSVQFALDGEHAQWFSFVQTQNSVSLTLSSAIPGSVITNNQQLVFVITARRPNSNVARATIVISLTDEYTEISNIGFDRVSYLGSIQDNAITLGPITVTEGYTDAVTFGLYGELVGYFSLSRQGPVVNVAIGSPIPGHLIPTNRIIMLEIRASAPQTGIAQATIVLEAVAEQDDTSVVQPVFAAPYYTGSYTTAGGLAATTPITLSEGYDDSVQFALDGEHAQWFSFVQTQNSVSLTLSSAIPGSVIINNQQLVFVITARRPNSNVARATIVISLTDEYTEISNIGFDRVSYLGSIQDNAITLGPITVTEGYTDAVTFGLYGELVSYFSLSRQGPVVNVAIGSPIPGHLIPTNRIIMLEIRASAPQTGIAQATIVLEAVAEQDDTSVVQPVFAAPYYTGSYTTAGGLAATTPITLSEGYDDSVQFALDGEHAQWFSFVQTQNSVSLTLSSAIPGSVIINNQQLVFVITARRPNSNVARATIVISLTDEYTEISNIGFDRVSYLGSIQDNAITLGPITVTEGYTDAVTFGLYGELVSYFSLSIQGPVVNVAIGSPIPGHLIPTNRIIMLEIRASAPQTGIAQATIVLEAVAEQDDTSVVQPVFAAPYYTGSYTTAGGLAATTPITLSEGYDDSVQFALDGEHAQWFSFVQTQNSVSLTLSSAIPGSVIINNQQLVFVITARRPNSNVARATIVISLTDEYTEISNIGFDRVSYLGSIQDNAITLGPITVTEGYTDAVTFGLYGELVSYFSLSIQGPVVNVAIGSPIPGHLIPTNRIIMLEIRASAPQTGIAQATIVLEAVAEQDDTSVVQPVFAAPYYTGSYTTAGGLAATTPITLSEGYDDSVQFTLEGESAQWFRLIGAQNSAILMLSSPIPDSVLTNNRQLVFVVTAQRPRSITARAPIVILLSDDLQIGDDVSFEKVLYEGIIRLNDIQHETINISGFDGTSVELFGEHSSLFVARVANGVVTVQALGSVTLPSDVTQLTLELHAAGARAVLLLNIVQADTPAQPSVTFSSETYVLTVEIVQTGLVGRVQATANNAEAVTYSLAATNEHLQTRLSINNEGELYLSAPANSGVYTFQVIATTVITRATGTATVYLTAEAVTVCGDDIVVPPLIILDRDEESAHNNLVVLDPVVNNGCRFSLTNRWPADQTWLYVNENGLHARAIDREHESIAFMAQSQVQVELILHCDNDNSIRSKRSERTDWLGPYDYGTKNWILTDTIPYNSRRSLVNLIVNDINDNAPIFVGKEFEPIPVGYPTDELEERILPRSLVELKATDADIGENAALRYSSSASELAVAPTTGFVHVRSPKSLYNDQILTVYATDRRGEGLTGSIQLQVKLLDLTNIAVVTVKNAFLDDENDILTRLGEAVGYEVKTLRTVVISDDVENDGTRNKRETETAAATLQLYVYGLIERKPVAVDRLAEDINNNAAIVSIIRTVSLEDHLEDNEINIIERDIGLLVATIILSILLFLLILLIAIWYFLKWRKNRNYDQFSDRNSLASQNESIEELPKPDFLKPRLNIDDLKKSERRLQEMLNAPIEEVTVEPMTPKTEAPLEAILNIPNTADINTPIVIQSIDKLKDAEDTDDEFGEIDKTRRKSVVTFNENVEKIIHVQDDTDSSSHSGYEIYKF